MFGATTVQQSPPALRAFQPPLLPSSTSSTYLALLRSFASTNQSSQGTISSTMTTCLVDSDVITTSGRSEVELELPSQVHSKVPVSCIGE